MSRKLAWLVAAAALVAFGCNDKGNELLIPDTPDDDGGTGIESGTPAFEFYQKEVHPQLDLTCTWCHAANEADQTPPGDAPQWLSLKAAQSYRNIDEYGSLIAHPENSLLLLQGEHMGPALTADQRSKVEEWLLMEVEERDLPTPEDPVDPGGPPANTAADALESFAACMTRDLWDEHEMNLLAHNQTAGWGPCRGCHNRGFAGAFLDDDETLTYEQNKKMPFLLKLVTAQVSDGGAFEDIVPSNRMVLKGTEICTYDDEALCHPKYALNPNINDNLESFYAAVHANWMAGTCGDAPMGGGGMGGGGGAGGGAQ